MGTFYDISNCYGVSVCGSRVFVSYLRMDSYSVICGDVSSKKLRLATYVKSGWEIIDVAILFDLFSLILICKATRSILAIAKDDCDARKWEFKFVVESAMHSGIWIPCKNVPHCAFLSTIRRTAWHRNFRVFGTKGVHGPQFLPSPCFVFD